MEQLLETVDPSTYMYLPVQPPKQGFVFHGGLTTPCPASCGLELTDLRLISDPGSKSGAGFIL